MEIIAAIQLVMELLGQANALLKKVQENKIDPKQMARGAQAVQRAREARKALGKSRNKAVKAMIIGGLLCCFIFIGCVSTRYTTETIWPGAAATDAADIAVEWPKGVKPEQILTTMVDGYAISVAPMPAGAVGK